MDGKKVFVYRNLIKRMFSIREIKSGRVVDADEAWLCDAQFSVSQTGRIRALLEKRRIIHAGIIGTLVKDPPLGPSCNVAVRYNPTSDTFVTDEEHRTVHEAPLVHLIDGAVYIPREEHWP